MLPDQQDISAYLTRLGCEAESPSVDALFRLHRAQVERVPYETMWIHMDDLWTIDPLASLRRVAHHRRGGYCFHLNGALALLLEALGYRVTRHVGGVHGPDGPDPAAMENHLVLLVHDLPTDDHPAGTWYLDTGLGDALWEPLPLRTGRYPCGPSTFDLDRCASPVAHWAFTHDPTGSFAGMAFRTESVPIEVFANRHRILSTTPDSTFTRMVTAQRRDRDSLDVLQGQVLKRVDRRGTTTITVNDRSAWFEAVAETFDLRFDDVTVEQRDRLWERVHAAHLDWQRGQASAAGG